MWSIFEINEFVNKSNTDSMSIMTFQVFCSSIGTFSNIKCSKLFLHSSIWVYKASSSIQALYSFTTFSCLLTFLYNDIFSMVFFLVEIECIGIGTCSKTATEIIANHLPIIDAIDSGNFNCAQFIGFLARNLVNHTERSLSYSRMTSKSFVQVHRVLGPFAGPSRWCDSYKNTR